MGLTIGLRDAVAEWIDEGGALDGADVRPAAIPPVDGTEIPDNATVCFVISGPETLDTMSTDEESSSASVHVAVYRKFSETGDMLTAEVDALVTQCDALWRRFLTETLRFDDYTAGCQSIRYEPYDMEMLHETGLFIGYALLTFEVC